MCDEELEAAEQRFWESETRMAEGLSERNPDTLINCQSLVKSLNKKMNEEHGFDLNEAEQTLLSQHIVRIAINYQDHSYKISRENIAVVIKELNKVNKLISQLLEFNNDETTLGHFTKAEIRDASFTEISNEDRSNKPLQRAIDQIGFVNTHWIDLGAKVKQSIETRIEDLKQKKSNLDDTWYHESYGTETPTNNLIGRDLPILFERLYPEAAFGGTKADGETLKGAGYTFTTFLASKLLGRIITEESVKGHIRALSKAREKFFQN